jgi:Tfp pilus assembly protein PilN
MANLLPKEERRRGEREYILRITSVSLFLFLVLVLFGIVLLLPSYFFSELQGRSVKERSELISRTISLREQDASSIILTATKQKVEELTRAQAQVSQITLIKTITGNLTPEVTISRFFYTRAESGNTVKIFGNATSREALTMFLEKLKQEELFTRVDLPVSSFARDADIDFSITLSGDF